MSTTRSAGLARLEPGELAHPADDLLLGRLADGAGVDDDEVRPPRARPPRRSRRPAARPAISSESVRFIWQPSVQTWKRGSARVLGQELGEAPSSGAAGAARRRSAPARRDLEHRQGAVGGRSVGHGCAGEPTPTPEPADAGRDLGRDPQRRVRLGVGHGVAMVVAAPGRRRGRCSAATSPTAADGRGVERAVVDLQPAEPGVDAARARRRSVPAPRRSGRGPRGRRRRGWPRSPRAGPRPCRAARSRPPRPSSRSKASSTLVGVARPRRAPARRSAGRGRRRPIEAMRAELRRRSAGPARAAARRSARSAAGAASRWRGEGRPRRPRRPGPRRSRGRAARPPTARAIASSTTALISTPGMSVDPGPATAPARDDLAVAGERVVVGEREQPRRRRRPRPGPAPPAQHPVRAGRVRVQVDRRRSRRVDRLGPAGGSGSWRRRRGAAVSHARRAAGSARWRAPDRWPGRCRSGAR